MVKSRLAGEVQRGLLKGFPERFANLSDTSPPRMFYPKIRFSCNFVLTLYLIVCHFKVGVFWYCDQHLFLADCLCFWICCLIGLVFCF